jgi:hypothetical protein
MKNVVEQAPKSWKKASSNLGFSKNCQKTTIYPMGEKSANLVTPAASWLEVLLSVSHIFRQQFFVNKNDDRLFFAICLRNFFATFCEK